MFKVADEARFVIQRFELAERLESFADNLPDPSQQAEQRKIAMEKTAREWAKEDVLRIEIHDPRMLIDPLSVHNVFHLVKELRAAGQTRLLLASVTRRLADAALLETSEQTSRL